MYPYTLVIHGGAGAIERAKIPADLAAAYRAALTEVLETAGAVLSGGGTSVDAVELAVALLEDNPLFNAGHGAVFTAAETHELEAAIMDGSSGRAGGVVCVRHVRNPIRLARRVMECTPHVLLAGEGAEAFAREQALPLVPAGYFSTDRRRQQLEGDRNKMEAARLSLSEDFLFDKVRSREPFGTVGAVALDMAGNLAAATSTGGMSNKRPGRVGDSAVIGAGCYADNATCAVSTTGHGEYFLRGVVAYDIAARIGYLGATPQAAAHYVICDKLTRVGGRGGAIALNRKGEFAMPFNSAGMYRGYINSGRQATVAIHAD